MDNTLGSKEWYDLDLWTCNLKFNRDHLLIGRNPCTKFGIDQAKGSKDIERTTQWAEKGGLTLTFEHVTWKSILIIHSLSANPAPSLVLIKWTGQKILSGQQSGLTLTFVHVTWKSIGIIYSTPAPSWYWSSEAVKRYYTDNIWTTDRQTDIPTDQLTDSCKTICPLFQGGGGEKKSK